MERRDYIFVFLMLVCFAAQIFSSLYFQNYWSGETEHSCAGYIYLTEGKLFNLATHGVLTGALSAIPLLFIDIDHPDWTTVPNIKHFCEFEFITYGDNDADLILNLTKIPMILIGVLGALFVFKWAKEFFMSPAAGFTALILYTLNPLVMAYSKVTNLDITTAVFFFITAYYFWKYYKTRETKHLVLTGVFLGLAAMTKPSAFVIIPCILLIGLMLVIRKEFRLKEFLWVFFKILFIGGVMFLIVHPLDWHPIYYEDDPLYAGGDFRSEEKLDEIVNKFPCSNAVKFFLTKVPVPASHYWQGFYPLFNYLFAGNTGAGSGYFKGYDTGAETSNVVKWGYSLLFKTPVPLMILTVLALFFIIKDRRFEYIFIFIPMLFYLLEFVVVGMVGGVRLLLPCYMLLFVLCGITGIQKKKVFDYIVTLLILWSMIVALLVYPSLGQHYNGFMGGPENAPTYFINADIDSKSDFKMLGYWMDEHGLQKIYLNTSIYGMSHIYGDRFIPFYPENRSVKGYVAISVSSLYGETPAAKDDFAWLRELEPIPQMDEYGYGIRVYRL